MEARSGISLLDVRVHPDSPLPGRIRAAAYATADEIHLGPGQGRQLAHEAWHVVQQRQGRVRPTASFDGVQVNRSGPLEHEADRVGRLASAGLTAADFRRPPASAAAVRSEVTARSGGVTDPPVLQGQWFSQTSWDTINPARWRINPYQLWRHYQESSYEQAHTKYHTMQRHGWVHPLQNVYERTQEIVPGGGVSKMRDLPAHPLGQLVAYGGGNIDHYKTTGRFVTAGWQHYAREQAIEHALAKLPPGTKFPTGAPPAKGTSYHRFGIDFSGAEVGLEMNAGIHAKNAKSVSQVQAGVRYHPGTGEAWLIQLFPTSAPKKQGAIPSATIKQQNIPWF